MIPTTYALITEAGIILILAFLLIWATVTAARERRELYSRLMARTLPEYQAATQAERKPEAVQVPSTREEREAAYEVGQTPNDYLESQTAFTKLMG